MAVWKKVRRGLARMLDWDSRPERGHRGVGLGKAPHTSRTPLSLPGGGFANREILSTEEVEAFLYDEQPLAVHSSNVATAIYLPAERALQIEYLSGDTWKYDPISENEALDFAQSHSKGVWLWDNVKRRGTVHEHRKNAVQIR